MNTNETAITAIIAVLGLGALGYIGYSSYSNAKQVAYGSTPDAAAASTPTGGRKHRTKKSKHGKNKRTHKK